MVTMAVGMIVAMPVVMSMIGALEVTAAGEHENMPISPHHLDLRTIELRQHRRRGDFRHGAERGMTVAQVEYAVECADQLVEFVGAEQNRNVALAGEAPDQIDHRFLVAVVEADERLIEQQELRLTKKRLREQQALPFSARHVGQGPAGEVRRADRSQRLFDHAAVGAGERRQAPALAVHGARDEIEAAHPQIGHDRPHLWKITDLRVAAPRRAPEDAQTAGARRQQTQDRADQRGLAGAIGPEKADELAALNGEACIDQDVTPADRDRCVIELDHIHDDGPAKARCVSSSCISIQSWYEEPAGAVSVMPTTGILEARASPMRCWTSLVGACLL